MPASWAFRSLSWCSRRLLNSKCLGSQVVRGAVTTVVELRKFEIRRRLVGGDFLKSRIRKAAKLETP